MITTPRDSYVLSLLVLFASMSLSAQSSTDLRFAGHTLGEPADIFFSTTRANGSHQLTKDYCKSLLDNSQVRQDVQKKEDAANSGGDYARPGKDFSVRDSYNCRQATAAIGGQQAHVGAQLATELGRGSSALFASGRLSALNLFVDTSYADTVASMGKRFGASGHKDKDMVARSGWRVHEETRWEKDGVLAAVWAQQTSDGSVVIVGFLEPPYEALLQGTIDPASAVSTPTQDCRASGSAERVQVSPGIMVSLLVHRVQPIYPEAAKQGRVEGIVVLGADIDECGRVVGVNPISGPAELVPAAQAAVKQWQYRPYASSGQAVAVTTKVQVRFKLSQ